MGWRYGAGGMLAALVLGAIGWPGTAAAQFSLPPTFNSQSRQLAPSNGAPVAPARPAMVPPSAGPPSGGFRSPPPMPGPPSTAGQVSLSLLARFGHDGQQISNGLVWRVFPARPDSGGVFRILKEDRGASPVGTQKFGSFVELHIEQGPILEAENKTIGVVQGVQGIRWYEIIVTGQEAHAGPTPMPRRKDALVAVSRMVTAVNRIGLSHPPYACATVGMLQVSPNSRNVHSSRA